MLAATIAVMVVSKKMSEELFFQESVGFGYFAEKFTRSNLMSLSCEDNGCSI